MKLLLDNPVRSLDLGDHRVEYTIQFSKTAKKCRIKVSPAGVLVVLPRGTEEDRAESFLQENETWVLDQIAFVERLGGMRVAPEPQGHRVLLRGQDTPVELVEETTSRRYCLVNLNEGVLKIRVPKGNSVKPWPALEMWFRRQARHDVLQQLAARRPKMPRSNYDRVYIMGQKTKWGNCSGKRNLSFNWRLVMAPPAVLDYLVVHELAHLAEPSHSVKFWLLVRSHCPRYEEHRDWLKNNETRMRLPE